ncbi:MAG: phosphoglycolate phosphatase [Pseudorhodobacter sp.]|jgi:phosphoglycolate phosphatase
MNAVIFDLDGTLIDSAPDIHAVANKVLVENGFTPLSLAKVGSFVGRGVPHLVACLLTELGQNPSGPRHATMMARFLELYETAVDLTQVYPNVQPALLALQAMGCQLGICTNKPLAPTHAVLRHLQLDGFFATVIGGDSLPQRKPDPAPLLAAMAEMGVASAIFVGDSEVDAATGQNAAQVFLLFTEGYRKTPVAELPHHAAFRDFAELPALVAALRGAEKA